MICESINLAKRFHFQSTKVEPNKNINKASINHALSRIFDNNT